LDGAWTCEGEGEFAYAIPPDACVDVFTDCPAPPRATEEEFLAYFTIDILCEEFLTCNPAFDCSIFEDLENGDTSDCTYDAEKAQECMDGDWTCEGEGEFAYAVPPDACVDVYDCPDDDDDDDD
jgi:hypothetical protein